MLFLAEYFQVEAGLISDGGQGQALFLHSMRYLGMIEGKGHMSESSL